MTTHVGKSVSWGQPHPHFKGAGPSVPKFLGPTTYAHTVSPKATKFGVVTDMGSRVFLGVSHCVNNTNYCVVVLKCLALSTTLILAN